MNATMTEKELLMIRVFDAPRELLWKAWTDPERFMRWWGPNNFTAPACRIDLRVGGKYLNCMRGAGPDGVVKDYWTTGVYREIIPFERLIYTDSFADQAGNVVPASYYDMQGDWPLEMMVTVTFKDHDGKTEMTLRHDGLPGGQMKEECETGWNESFDKLDESLKQDKG